MSMGMCKKIRWCFKMEEISVKKYVGQSIRLASSFSLVFFSSTLLVTFNITLVQNLSWPYFPVLLTTKLLTEFVLALKTSYWYNIKISAHALLLSNLKYCLYKIYRISFFAFVKSKILKIRQESIF